nr:hypothetical protein [Pantoea agglomerans]
MKRYELEYSMYYSYYLEKMYATLTGRIDKGISFLLLLSGSAVFASFGSNVFFGFFVAFLTCLSLIYEFGKKSSAALEHSKAYHELIIIKDTLSEDELLSRFKAINKNDNPVWNCLSVAARKRAILAIHGKNEEVVYYTPLQYIMSWLAGDKP